MTNGIVPSFAQWQLKHICWKLCLGAIVTFLSQITFASTESRVGEPRFAFTTANAESLLIIDRYFAEGDYISVAVASRRPRLAEKVGKHNQYKLVSSLREVEAWAAGDCESKRGAGTIIYDNEIWDATPVNEQQNILGSINKAEELVSQSGCRKFGIAPARIFLSKSRQTCYSNINSLNYRIDWSKISLLVIQAQGMLQEQCTQKYGVANYKAFVEDIARIAKQANRELIVLAEVSFNRSKPETIIQAIDYTKYLVDGFYLAYPNLESCKYCTPANLEMVLSKYRSPQ